MTKNAILGLGLLALIILAVLCVWSHAGSIVTARIDAPPFVDLSADAGRIIVNGVMPDDATGKQFVTNARIVFGAGLVTDQLRVADRVGEPAWMGEALAVMPLLARSVDKPGMRISGDTLTLRGEVASQEAKADVLQKAVAAVDNALTVKDQLVVVAREAQLAFVQGKLDDELRGRTIEFEINSARITPEGATILDRLIPIIQSVESATIEIAGHTDSRGTDAENLELSQARAESVREYCVAKGVRPERLKPVGYGETKPIDSNATTSGRLANRRIEFHLLQGE